MGTDWLNDWKTAFDMIISQNAYHNWREIYRNASYLSFGLFSFSKNSIYQFFISIAVL